MERAQCGGHTGISKSTVARYFALFGIQPHRAKSFKLSTDPFFVEKVRDVVGLYLNPPDKALVLCVDEKSQIQALERTRPVLPMGLGYVEGVTHDYYRHGATTLFCRAQRSRRGGHHPVQTAPSAIGLSLIPPTVLRRGGVHV